MITTLIFDLGNVLVKVNHKLLIETLKNAFDNRITFDELKTFLSSSPNLYAYQIGSIDSDQFHRGLQKELNFQIAKDTLKKYWQEILDAIDENVALLPILKQHYKLAIISDTNPWHVDFIREKFNIFEHFRELIFSYEVHLMKPDPQIFELTMKCLESEPETCVYIDDLEHNVEAARQLNMHGIHYKTHPQLVRELRGFEVKF